MSHDDCFCADPTRHPVPTKATYQEDRNVVRRTYIQTTQDLVLVSSLVGEELVASL